MIGRWRVGAVLAALGASSVALGAPIFDDQERDYDVSGRTMGQIRAAMDAGERPTDPSGWAHDAYTHWNVRATWVPRVGDDGRCAIGDVVVRLSTVTTLPSWTDRATGPKGTWRRWEAYVSTLAAHEAGHRAIDHAIGERLESALAAIPAVDSCAAIDALAHVAIDETVAWGRGENVRYDEVTTHGREQDAWLADGGSAVTDSR